MYYAQAWFLALYHKLLFAERIEAWVHGPVVPELYRRFKPYKWNAIAERVKRPSLPEKIEKHLLEVLDAYGRFSAWELERLTHSELPWMDARKGLSIEENGSRTIGPEAMRDFYQKLATRG